MVEAIAIFAAGVFAWTFLEYLIHGWLGHTFHSFATRLHWVHHRDPHAVFTVGAWLPIAILWTTLAVVFRFSSWMILLSGAVAGFAAYELLHYRIHFCRPGGPVADYLRSRHLAHHESHPDRCFGVTSAIWDLAFGTEPLDADLTALYESMRSRAPLTGPTNLYKLKRYMMPFPLASGLARPRERSRLDA